MSKKKRIPKIAPEKGARFNAPSPKSYDEEPIAFSLNRIQCNSGFCFSDLPAECKASFAESIFKRRSTTWKEVRSMPRHALGTEKIAAKSLKTELPPFITEDSETLLAFRYNGKKAMVGYRVRDIFYVLWFDPSFTLYDHG